VVKNLGVLVVKTRKAFTLVELTVAVALLAMMISFSAVILKISISSQRLAAANAEIMQKFRAITGQLNSDFSGLCRDAPMFIWFELDPNTGARYDQIMFFAAGDFTSTQPYRYDSGQKAKIPFFTGSPVRGNVARIYYGQANSIDYAVNYDTTEPYWVFNTLARRCHILTVNPALIADISQRLILFPDITDFTAFASTFVPFISNLLGNNVDEHDSLSLAEWKLITQEPAYTAYNNQIVFTCFDNTYGRPKLDLKQPRTLHMLMTEGLGSFKIQWAYPFDISNPNPPPPLIRQWRWWPSVDPDQDGFYDDDSDFFEMRKIYPLPLPSFGVFFKTAGVSDPMLLWFSPDDAQNVYIGSFPTGFFPKALKFTFTLYDSKGVIEDGRTFTHIVYLDD